MAQFIIIECTKNFHTLLLFFIFTVLDLGILFCLSSIMLIMIIMECKDKTPTVIEFFKKKSTKNGIFSLFYAKTCECNSKRSKQGNEHE